MSARPVAPKTRMLEPPGASRATVAGVKKMPTPTIPLTPSARSASAPTGRREPSSGAAGASSARPSAVDMTAGVDHKPGPHTKAVLRKRPGSPPRSGSAAGARPGWPFRRASRPRGGAHRLDGPRRLRLPGPDRPAEDLQELSDPRLRLLGPLAGAAEEPGVELGREQRVLEAVHRPVEDGDDHRLVHIAADLAALDAGPDERPRPLAILPRPQPA